MSALSIIVSILFIAKLCDNTWMRWNGMRINSILHFSFSKLSLAHSLLEVFILLWNFITLSLSFTLLSNFMPPSIVINTIVCSAAIQPFKIKLHTLKNNNNNSEWNSLTLRVRGKEGGWRGGGGRGRKNLYFLPPFEGNLHRWNCHDSLNSVISWNERENDEKRNRSE